MRRRDVLRLGAVGTWIIAMHGAMPKKLVMPSTGTRVIFGDA